MTIINLDPSFKPYGEGVAFDSFNFPSGCEAHIKLKEAVENEVLITCRIQDSNDIMRLLLATDALKRAGAKEIRLFMPYLPYARQDRQMVKGEPLSLKVFANLLNSQGYSKVSVYDVHSEVALALIENSEGITNHSFAKCVFVESLRDYYIVCPDAGAYKKIYGICKSIGYEDEIIIANKVRDVSTGLIKKTTVSHSDLKQRHCYIVDDICDGGGTFVLLAEELLNRNAKSVNLVVSHGIFSKGLPLLKINHVFVTDSFSDMPEQLKLTQIKLCNTLI